MKEIISNEEILKGLKSRYAVKQFSTNIRLSNDKKELIKDILSLTPTSFGLQLYKFIIVKNPKIRTELRKVSWGQSQITDSDFVIVFCVYEQVTKQHLEKHSDNIQKIRHTSDEEKVNFTSFMNKTILQGDSLDAIKDMDEWQAKQAYIALGNIMTAASLTGIDTCPIEGMDCKKYDEILGLADLGLKSKVVLAVGTRSKHDEYQAKEKVRFPKKDLFIEI